ncbi:hypothetical protein OU416_31050 [Saccharopolyspora indica]|nr:hypothetical protein [Saccharopolyspora indica]MDA3648533.1 hypothetical protein [Saccharopolyspora indica]
MRNPFNAQSGFPAPRGGKRHNPRPQAPRSFPIRRPLPKPGGHR